MKVLFVSSGNIKKFGISPIVVNQGVSIEKKGVSLDHYGLKGRGIINYIKSILKLRKHLLNNNYDIIHSHYSLSGIAASLASKNTPVVASLMGSDIAVNFLWRYVIKYFYRFKWAKTIVKSEKMKTQLSLSEAVVIPNGVDFDKFCIIDKSTSRKIVNFKPNKQYVIFVADPERDEKNFSLAKAAVDLLADDNIELFVVFGENGVDHDLIPFYMNATDVLLLTSKREGSPNVIKEAMACNCPIVSTDVGDVRNVINDTRYCHVTSFNAIEISQQIKKFLRTSKKTNGREQIWYLDSNRIADKIISIYNTL